MPSLAAAQRNPTDKQARKRTNNQTNNQTNKQTSEQTNKQTTKQTNKRLGRTASAPPSTALLSSSSRKAISASACTRSAHRPYGTRTRMPRHTHMDRRTRRRTRARTCAQSRPCGRTHVRTNRHALTSADATLPQARTHARTWHAPFYAAPVQRSAAQRSAQSERPSTLTRGGSGEAGRVANDKRRCEW